MQTRQQRPNRRGGHRNRADACMTRDHQWTNRSIAIHRNRSQLRRNRGLLRRN